VDHHLPTIGRRSWVGATILGASVAWCLGMIRSTLMSLGAEASAPAEAQFPDALQYALAMPMGAVAGVILA